MPSKNLMSFAAPTFAVALAAVGCASSQAPVAQPAAVNVPAWVNKTAYVEGRSLFGVGIAAGIRNRGLAHTVAGNRARAELSKLVSVYSASLMRDYSASISANGETSEEQVVEQAVKTFSKQLQRGVEIRGFFFDDAQGIIYALAELNLDKQAQFAAARTKMGSSFQTYAAENQDRVLQQIGQSPSTE